MTEAAEPANYAAAVDELDQILSAIERDEVDVDILSMKVARAVVLVQYCRDRIAAAEIEVERVVAELASEGEPDG